jgi:hypothetical protein
MIAPQLVPRSSPRRKAVFDDARARRIVVGKRRTYAPMRVLLLAIGAIFVPLTLYVLLTANLTALNYALAHANDDRAVLQEETVRLDDQIAQLRSRERLLGVAQSLKMHDATTFAIIDLPNSSEQRHPQGIALLESFFTKHP